MALTAGVALIDTSLAGPTLTGVDAVAPLVCVTVIVAFPADIPLMRPDAVTDTTPAFDDVHVSPVVRGLVVPSDITAVTFNAAVRETRNTGLIGVIPMDATVTSAED
jgi:hypothetical protein